MIAIEKNAIVKASNETFNSEGGTDHIAKKYECHSASSITLYVVGYSLQIRNIQYSALRGQLSWLSYVNWVLTERCL